MADRNVETNNSEERRTSPSMTVYVHKDGLRPNDECGRRVVEIKLNGEEFTEKMLSGRGLDSIGKSAVWSKEN